MARFLARVDQYKQIIPAEPNRVLRYVGKDVWVSIHEQPTVGLRSLDSNRYYWKACVQRICEETGNDPETVHLALKAEALRVGVLPVEYVCIGDQLLPAEPTTVQDSETFSKYVQWVIDWARTKLDVHIEESNG